MNTEQNSHISYTYEYEDLKVTVTTDCNNEILKMEIIPYDFEKKGEYWNYYLDEKGIEQRVIFTVNEILRHVNNNMFKKYNELKKGK